MLLSYQATDYLFTNSEIHPNFSSFPQTPDICGCGYANVHVEIPVMEGRFEACYCGALWFSSMSLEEISRLFLNTSRATHWWSEKRKIWITNSCFIANVWLAGRVEDCYRWALRFSLMSLKEISGLFLNSSRVTHRWLEKKKIWITDSCFITNLWSSHHPMRLKQTRVAKRIFFALTTKSLKTRCM